MPTLNIADLSLAILWLFFVVRGYLRGLVKEVGSLAAIIAGFYCAGTYHRTLAPHLTSYISGNYAGTAAYLIIFALALLGVWFVALAISGVVRITMTQWADRFFGGCFGLLKGVIISAVLLFLLHLAVPDPEFLSGSLLVPELRNISTRLSGYIPPDINEKLRKFSRKDLPEPVTRAVAKTAVPEKKPEQPAPAEAKPAEKPQAPTEPAKAAAEKKPAEQTKAQTDKKSPPAPSGGTAQPQDTAKKPAPARPAAGQPAGSAPTAHENAHE